MNFIYLLPFIDGRLWAYAGQWLCVALRGHTRGGASGSLQNKGKPPPSGEASENITRTHEQPQ